jgi:archaellum component FlaC
MADIESEIDPVEEEFRQEQRQIKKRMAEGLDKMDKQTDMLREGLKLLADADEVSNVIADNLHKQGKQIKGSEKKLDNIDENMRDAKKHISVMSMSFWNPFYWIRK